MCVCVCETDESAGLTPQLVIVRAALGLSTAVAHLTAVLFIVHPETKLLPLSNKHKHSVKHRRAHISLHQCLSQTENTQNTERKSLILQN